MNSLQKFTPAIIVIAVIALGAVGVLGYKYHKAQQEIQTISTDPSTVQKAAAEEVKALVSQVSKLIDLPSGEDPTVATITDISKLKSQPFFANAKNGDKLLIYTNSKKAILFDPTANKIVDVAPVNIGSSSATQSNARIVIRNSTSVAGLGTKISALVKQSFPQANIVNLDNSNNNYDKTTVISISDAAKSATDSLAQALGVTVGTLPAGESKPDADILILVGKDKAQ